MKQIRKYSVYLILPLLLTFLTAFCCVDDEIGHFETAQLVNQLDEKIFFSYLSYDKEHQPAIDNKYIFEELRYARYLFKDIEAKASYSELYVEEGKNVSVIIFKESTLAKYSVAELVETNYCDKYYNYSYDELKAMNFTITYTGE
jgi:hypothetical protein